MNFHAPGSREQQFLAATDISAVGRNYPQFGRTLMSVARPSVEVFQGPRLSAPRVAENPGCCHDHAETSEWGHYGCQPVRCDHRHLNHDPRLDCHNLKCAATREGCLTDADTTCTIQVICEVLVPEFGAGEDLRKKLAPKNWPENNPRIYAWHCEIETVDCSGKKRGEQIGGAKSHVKKTDNETHARNKDGTFVGAYVYDKITHTLPCPRGCMYEALTDPCDIEALAASYPYRNDPFVPIGRKANNCNAFVAWTMNKLGLPVPWKGEEGCNSEAAEAGK
jgi:hypothetical protein